MHHWNLRAGMNGKLGHQQWYHENRQCLFIKETISKTGWWVADKKAMIKGAWNLERRRIILLPVVLRPD